MNIFVAGASGCLGSAVARSLKADGHYVTGMAHHKSQAGTVEETGASVVVGDLLEPGPWQDAVRDSDMVVSLCSPMKPWERLSFPEARRRSYHHGQMVGNIFLAAQGAKVRGVLVSYGVLGYGDRGDALVPEHGEIDPKGYERAITGAYWHIDKTSRKTKVPLVNVFTGWVYGPHSAWFERTVRGIRDGSAKVVGDGSNYMSLIHIDDVAAAYSRMVEDMPLGERICLVDGDPVTQRELMEFTAGCMGCAAPELIDRDSYARLAGDLAAESMTTSVRMTAERTRRVLGLELKYPSYRVGIPPTVEAMAQPAKEEKAA